MAFYDKEYSTNDWVIKFHCATLIRIYCFSHTSCIVLKRSILIFFYISKNSFCFANHIVIGLSMWQLSFDPTTKTNMFDLFGIQLYVSHHTKLKKYIQFRVLLRKWSYLCQQLFCRAYLSVRYLFIVLQGNHHDQGYYCTLNSFRSYPRVLHNSLPWISVSFSTIPVESQTLTTSSIFSRDSYKLIMAFLSF